MIRIAVDPDAGTPPFEQVRAQLAAAISDGTLVTGLRLPTVRRLADDLGLAPNTVARAFRELELAGLIETRGRHGSFVAGAPSPTRARAVEAARTYVAAATDLGLSSEESLAIVRREIESATLAAVPGQASVTTPTTTARRW